MNEEELYNIKRKTTPLEHSIYGTPRFNYSPPTHKHYSEVEVLQQQAIFKENYHKATHNNQLSFMQDSLDVLKKLMEQEKADGHKTAPKST